MLTGIARHGERRRKAFHKAAKEEAARVVRFKLDVTRYYIEGLMVGHNGGARSAVLRALSGVGLDPGAVAVDKVLEESITRQLFVIVRAPASTRWPADMAARQC